MEVTVKGAGTVDVTVIVDTVEKHKGGSVSTSLYAGARSYAKIHKHRNATALCNQHSALPLC